MMLFRNTNPVLRSVEKSESYVTDNPITYSGVMIKTLYLIAILFLSGYFTLSYAEYITPGILIGAMVVGFISVMIGTRSTRLAPLFSTIYAVCEGAVLAILSFMFATMYAGIVPVALITTLVVFVTMLLLYSTKIIKVNQRFASIMTTALISVIFMGIISIFTPFGGSFYYLIVVFSAVLSAFFLLLNFSSIENAVENQVDSKIGWALSLSLLVTIVWIYVEMLRILAIFGRRR